MTDPRRESQTLKALLGVRDLVISGAFGAGQRLSEPVLSQRLGISRTPLRAALSRLEQEGLLEPIPSGGYAVRSFSINDIYDSIELRGVLEGTAARLAAERGVDAARLASIQQILVALDGTFRGRPEDMLFVRYVELNAEFHVALAGLAGSETIRREVERAARLPFASPSAFLERQEDVLAFRRSLAHAQRQHHELVSAVERREGSRAEALAREHARLARHNLELVTKVENGLLERFPGLAMVSQI